MKPPKKGHRRYEIVVTIDAPAIRRDKIAHLCRDIRGVFDWDDELKVSVRSAKAKA